MLCCHMQQSCAMLHSTDPEPPPGLRYEPVAELTAPRDPTLNFTTFENSIFIQKRTLVKPGSEIPINYYRNLDLVVTIAKIVQNVLEIAKNENDILWEI